MKEFTLASFNIGSCSKMYNGYDERDLRAVARAIGDSGADIIGCQEVDFGCRRSKGVDMPKYFSENAGYPYYHFIKIRDFQGGEYGTLLLSKFPIVERATINYKVDVATQGTSCGYIVADIGGQRVTVFNTHLSIESEAGNLDTLRCLNDELTAYKASRGGFLCTGDYNTQSDVVLSHVKGVRAANKDLKTYADVSIDNVLYTEEFTVTDVRTVETTRNWVSDHNMLLMTIAER